MLLPVFSLLLVAIVCSAATAQDKIELYTNFERTECALSENVDPPVVKIYVWLTGPVPASLARFTVPKPDCWQGATWLGDSLNPLHISIGDSQTDWSTAFFSGHGGCIADHTPPIFIGTVEFVVAGQSLPCCEVKAQPGVQYVFVDCTPDYDEHSLTEGQSVFVNPDASCPCQLSELPLRTEASSWGRVKSLYR